MIPIMFPEANARFGPPEGLEESQCMTVPAFLGQINGGSVDGLQVAVVAWQPSDEDLKLLNAGHPLFLSFIGGMPPHYVCMDFQTSIHPA